MKKLVTLMAGLVFIAALAAAQEARKLGLNLRIDPAPRIGLSYHISGRLALRPSIGFVQTSVEADSEAEARLPGEPRKVKTEKNATHLSFGLGLHYYVLKAENFSVYSGLNVNYARNTSDLSVDKKKDIERNGSGNIWQGSAVLGVQTPLNEHFSLFGEVGFGCTYQTFERKAKAKTDGTSKSWGLANSGIGLIFYF